MSAALGDLLSITVKASLFGEDVYNIFYYRVTSVTGIDSSGYVPLVDEFVTQVLTPQRALQSDDVIYQEALLKNLTNGVDFAFASFAPASIGGTVAQPSMPSFLTLSFRLQRESLATNNGGKHIAGVPEGFVTGNTFVGSSSLLTDYADALAADIVVGLVTLCEPVIVKRPIPVPATIGYVYSSVGGADYRKVGTQNSRKPGSGS